MTTYDNNSCKSVGAQSYRPSCVAAGPAITIPKIRNLFSGI